MAQKKTRSKADYERIGREGGDSARVISLPKKGAKGKPGK